MSSRPLALAVAASAALFVVVGGAVGADGSRQLQVGMVLAAPTVSRAADPIQYEVYRGLLQAQRGLHVGVRAVAPNPAGSGDQYFAQLSYLARQRSDLVIAGGIVEASALARAAKRFPQVRFALLDGDRGEALHPSSNIEGSVFHTEEASYLAGFLSARMADRRPQPHVVSIVTGFHTPQVDSFIAGFRAGAHRADPRLKVLTSYTGDFVNAAKCKHAALAQIAHGSSVVFNVAGKCGLGALRAAKQQGVYGVGVDIDQSYLGKFILTSVVKRLDVGVYTFAKRLAEGRLRTGGNLRFDLRNGGVRLGKLSPLVPRAIRRELIPLTAQIEQSKIVVPATLSR